MKTFSQMFGGRGIAALAMRTLTLSEDEERLVGQLRGQIRKFANRNKLKNDFYEGKQITRQLDIAVPPGLKDLAISMGWPGTAVDVLEERLDLLGWTSVQDLMGLDDVFRENSLGVEAGRGHLDALITGTDFITVGRGDTDYGEPEVLITVESASSATALRNYRTRRLDSALSQTRGENGAVEMETLYLPNSTICFQRNERTKKLDVVSRDDHNAGRVFMARLVNRDRASDLEGRSEITRPVMYYTDAAIRTMLGMEINREFYTAPSRYALGAEPEQFGVNENSTQAERTAAGWNAAMGRFNIIPRTEDGQMPTIGEFKPAPPTPYSDQVKMYSQLLSAETGIPSTYLGFFTDNPASADSIRQAEYRLVKRAERRQGTFGQGWREVAYLSLLARDGKVNADEFRKIGVRWRDASTPTRAATADAGQKLVAAEILRKDSPVTYDYMGFSEQDQLRLQEENRLALASELPSLLREKASQVTNQQAIELASRRNANGAT
ncbi:phage portal protein [Rhodococcus globerulus]|uniref:phage portal protein n=1 Tax=Rhodococcus globerulus TaxID=33008 RepID=UPI001C5773DC|nr:phage portal protein [Rhodococcus globerulus]QXW04019.1 phage portal protein [Rhodococcus globerulus]